MASQKIRKVLNINFEENDSNDQNQSSFHPQTVVLEPRRKKQKRFEDKFQVKRVQRGFFQQSLNDNIEYEIPIAKKQAIEEKNFITRKQQIQKSQTEKKIPMIRKNSLVFFNFDEDSGEQEKEIQKEGPQLIFKQDKDQLSQPQVYVPQNTGNKITLNHMLSKIDKAQFCYSPIEKGKVLQAMLLKPPSIMSIMYPQFDMIFFNERSHILSCKQQMASIGTNYYISTDEENINEKNEFYLGKIRRGLDDFHYNVYKCRDSNCGQKGFLAATIIISRKKRLRHVEIYLLKPGVYPSALKGNTKQKVGLNYFYKFEENTSLIHQFVNRKPFYQKKEGTYNLNFNGRALEQSVRNIIIQDPKTKEEVMMLGKLKNNIYRIDISSPFSPFLALGVLIPCFQLS